MVLRFGGIAATSIALASLVLVGCEKPPTTTLPPPVSADNHTYFPIGAGSMHELGKSTVLDGTFECASCHRPSAPTLQDVHCDTCHKHPQDVSVRLHLGVADFAIDTSAEPDPDVAAELRGQKCFSCHPTGEKQPFSHTQIIGDCIMCHDVGRSFAALPIPDGRAHRETNGADCSSCHVTTSWKDVGAAPPGLIPSPGHDVSVTAFIPLYASQGVDISLLTQTTETFPMNMDHLSADIPAAANACTTCHAGASAGNFSRGLFHSSIANQTITQPTKCGSCHANALPVGFVGPLATNPARTPPSPEMKHDALTWPESATSTALVTSDCGVCHLAPGTGALDWTAGAQGTSGVFFHTSLANAGLAQPSSCADCHANTMPRTVLSLTTGTKFDHAAAEVQLDCAGCHAASSVAPFSSWQQGRYHLAGQPLPTQCTSCHEGERPTTTTGWLKPNYTAAPFDYVTNSLGDKHGAGLDCVTCHANPGTGQWGSNQNWAGGAFTHPATLTSCVTCHSTQRPDRVMGQAAANTALSFDHVVNGAGDCVGCHQASVMANTYARYFNPGTGTLPGGDWQGGITYPGGFYAASTTASIVVNVLTLNRSGPNNLVTSMNSASLRLFNGMLHTSAQVPAQMAPGPTGMPDNTTCWHCHTSTGTTVTSVVDGKFHQALMNFRTTPAAAITALPQPTTGCADCHQAGLPLGIVERAGAAERPMDHAAQFAAAVTLGGKSVTAVNQADCSVCHAQAGGNWNDGEFHSKIGAAQPRDCVTCHYPLMADGTKADKTPAAGDVMKHRSGALTTQACSTCHPNALAMATTVTAAGFAGGKLHPNLTPQPLACVDCHAAAQPTTTTQGTVTWTFAMGGTATNGGQYLSHTSPLVAARDCSVCHQSDAKAVGAAWSRDQKFHQPVPTGVTACSGCHGLTNGLGTVVGTNNNLPQGLTDSSTTTTASAASGVSGLKDQLTHEDLNVTTRDCASCHLGSTTSWKGSRFHTAMTAASPLIINGTTARCSNCHLNVKPTAAYTQQDHSTFTSAPGTQDCSSCHAFPGTGTAAAPNWLGATGAPIFISVGGFSIPAPPAATGGTLQPGIMNLPHPSAASGTCLQCHQTSGGGRAALGYDHGSALISTNCGSCHEAGSGLLATPWNGATTVAAGAGDTRPFTLTSLVAQFGNGLTVNDPKHFFPADCGECHLAPAGLAVATTGLSYGLAWSFPHDTQKMVNPTTCLKCHVNGIPAAPDGGVADPGANVSLTTLVPRWTATTISSVSTQNTVLPMNMVHSSPEVKAPASAACANCHLTASSGVYFPGTFHSALANLAQAQPTTCVSCHGTVAPAGFVGPTATSPARTPASGEMRHDAVSWNVNVRGTTLLVGTECAACHVPPSATLAATWAMSADGGTARYHASLTAQPGSCLDCHANSRPTTVLASTGTSLPAGVTFDHASGTALNDCASCHVASTSAPWASWTNGKFHLAGGANPATCLPCHAQERPTATTGWQSTTYTRAPFDYGTNDAGVTHGDGLDCKSCHAGPGTGAWGSTQNWVGGNFVHGAGTPSATTCIACHRSQRPDLVLGVAQANTAVGFDHSLNGTGDCLGCHQATVVANTYARYFNAGTNMLPNGDWQGGVTYPGSVLVSAPTQSITLNELHLVRSGPTVTAMTQVSETINNAMLHTSAQLPAALNAGPTGSPDSTKCWHCHTSTGTTVTSFANGQYHSALSTYRATPGGTLAPFPQPTKCNDCHDAMYPNDIVRADAGTPNLQPMDHAATFATSVNLGGASVTAVNQADCSVCHKATPGTTWGGALFHANIGAGTPADCVTCHYPLMVDPTADVTSGTTFAMRHQSPQVQTQACATCHTTALANAATASHAITLWKTGTLHPHSSPQPTACLDCHAVSDPTTATQGTTTYVLALGGTTSNGGQWNNHTSSWVVGKDCVVCHAADAKTSGSAWNRADTFHPAATTANTCTECHGTGNGKGTVIGTNNNLPLGLTNSTKVSASAGSPNTGIPAGFLAQLTHADVNVTALDCGVCHTQKGTSTAPGVQGKEWAQATFHAQYTGARALVLNTTTGRCSNCHFGEKPGAAFTAFDHGGVTNVSGSQDCASCHSFPGTGTASAPNWLGAAGVPTYLSVGGFTIPSPPAATGGTLQAGITNLPHPSTSGLMCTTCHDSASGGVNAKGYDHASTLITTKCTSCHEAGSNLVKVPWNGSTTIAAGAGDTRPFTILLNTASFSGNTCRNFTAPNHFFPTNCHECHATPTGVRTPSTGATWTTAWGFVHKESNMTNPATCNKCHAAPANCPKG